MLPIKFQVNWPFGSEKEAKNRFSSILDLQVTLIFLFIFDSIGLSVQEKKRKIDFQDGGHSGNLGFPI